MSVNGDDDVACSSTTLLCREAARCGVPGCESPLDESVSEAGACGDGDTSNVSSKFIDAARTFNEVSATA